ncbi:hypothetical protein JW766_06320 [Candidatus Dojkabacteria bacterium]|nr:hypothetical protein [Candidatus Dojkabacteria bacterium]
MPQNNNKKPNSTAKLSFWDTVKKSFRTDGSKKMFPWFQSGLLLVGFAAGVLVTSGVDIISRLDLEENDTKEEESENQKCMDKGGRYDEDTQSCIMTTDDRGDACSKNEDCEGWCLIGEDATLGAQMNGYCSDNFKPKGCFKYIDNGKVNSICMP